MNILKKILPVLIGIYLCILFIGARDIGYYPDKIWLHRCNSMEKLLEKHKKYPNIEVDLVFRANRTFDVTHDADTTFNLSLDSYFSYMKRSEGKMWLDIKNLTCRNCMTALARLNKLIKYFQIKKERLIIESQDWKALNAFTKAGYYTSYYVAYDEPSGLSAEEMSNCIEELQEIVDKHVVCALSFPGDWYTAIKEKLDRSIDFLTWEHRISQLQFLLSSAGREMLSDPQLKVVLVKDKGKYHR